ncbi:hypothetical protein ADL22_23640 [Streptomyces sp. NRRL F-4489]|uniref:hypothetical protein n=1 Tax=Streptomyces sp. NRRL F-4489 TaxID=1609095 RepID=UPI00074A12B1|nr:hypothetical protein [Streptomyces sp. NRRL F-4489]KUL36889.1 hypothetical protein ADL22_23640 [Streptomyces sp. NRRL F-4489]
MTHTGVVLRQLHDAETELAKTYRSVAERQSADPGTHYPALTLAEQCDRHAERIRAWGERFGVRLHAPTAAAEPLAAVRDALKHTAAEVRGDRPSPGIALLHDLCLLHEKAQAAGIQWVVLGQVAQALRDRELLDQGTACHDETLTQIKWITTRVKEAAPQAVCVGPSE